jgi:hypothetical protein
MKKRAAAYQEAASFLADLNGYFILSSQKNAVQEEVAFTFDTLDSHIFFGIEQN